MDRSIHKRRREVLPGLDRDEDLTMLSGHDKIQERITHPEDGHSPLFVSRPTSEERPSSRIFPAIKGEAGRLPGDIERQNAELKFKIPSFLDNEDQKAFIQKGFRAAVPATYVHGVKPEPGTASLLLDIANVSRNTKPSGSMLDDLSRNTAAVEALGASLQTTTERLNTAAAANVTLAAENKSLKRKAAELERKAEESKERLTWLENLMRAPQRSEEVFVHDDDLGFAGAEQSKTPASRRRELPLPLPASSRHASPSASRSLPLLPSKPIVRGNTPSAAEPQRTPKPRSHAQPQRPTSSSNKGLSTIIKSKPPIQELASSPVSQALRSPSAPTQQPTPPSSTQVIKAPREPNKALKRNTTSLYARYDPVRNNVGPLAGTYKGTYRIYDAYSLVIDPTMTIGQLPTSGVRVDDFHAGKLLISAYTSKILFQAWPAEFDHNGMIRATRIPLGHAAKRWRQVGETDIDGKVVQQGQEGWYYDWWRGLHCLMGKEGYDAGLYLVRPSFETFRCEGMTFKMDYKAVVQLPTDDPNDPTPGL
ncbi:MAG: hypothetical protein Q9172_003887 [Xanthocarpia lactea]